MTVFPSAKHLCSWAGCCPRNDQSGIKVKSTRISRAGTFLKPLLVQIANALIKSKTHTEFGERYRRIKARRGHKKAIIAICRMLLTAIWNILKNHVFAYFSHHLLNVRLDKLNFIIAESVFFIKLTVNFHYTLCPVYVGVLSEVLQGNVAPSCGWVMLRYF